MLRSLSLVAVLAAATDAAAASRPGLPAAEITEGSAPVVGGSAVPPGKWPDAAAVLGAMGSCTGTLIAPDVVITAGHCAEINPAQVIADSTDYTAGTGEHVNVKSTTAYTDWETSYDIAVIVLAAPITGVTPRKVATSCTLRGFTSATPVHLVGFGLTDATGQGDNTQLNEAMATVTDPMCSSGHGCNPKVAPGGEFIAGGNGTDSCFGDSGGPVYLDTPRGQVVIGAVSRGVDNAPTPCGGGGIYVRTDKIVTWLEQTTGKVIAKDDCTDSDTSAPTSDAELTGGCTTSGNSSSATLLLLAGALFRRRRLLRLRA